MVGWPSQRFAQVIQVGRTESGQWAAHAFIRPTASRGIISGTAAPSSRRGFANVRFWPKADARGRVLTTNSVIQKFSGL